MHSTSLIRNVALGAALAGAAIAAIPGVASAASSCTFDPATKTMTVINDAPGGQPLTLRNSSTLTFRDGSGTNRSCLSPATGAAASSFNTTKIKVKPAVASAFQDTVIDESNNGRFVTSSGARMSLAVTTGTGNDHLGVLMGTGLDQVRVRSATTGLAFGPAIDLDSNGVVDVAMTAAGLVTVDGGGGSDLIDGAGSNTFQLELMGGASGNDTLRGGGLTDFLDGGIGNDTIVSSGDGKQDFVNGGLGTDRAVIDPIDSVSSVEKVEL